MSELSIDYLLSSKAVNDTTENVFDYIQSGKGHFTLHMDRLDTCANYVIDVIKENYPSLDIPYHSRWGHFKVGGVDRIPPVYKDFSGDNLQWAESKFDLVIISVLLDAGSGPDWSYIDPETQQTLSRSEGLAVASLQMFKSGSFSSDSSQPLRVDAERLKTITEQDLIKHFQVTKDNPLVGLEGRARLLQTLGQVIESNNTYFPSARLGDLVVYLQNKFGTTIRANELLSTVLKALGEIWPGRTQYNNVNLGDVWSHSQLGSKEESYVVFHKLSQWLTYSLIEPLEEANFVVSHLDALTGLAEYRNGGLFVDQQVIEVKDKLQLEVLHAPGSDLVIEWRALTVQLLKQISTIIRNKLSLTEENFPLVKILEGGTWRAGRKVAKSLRASGEPPIKIKSDGTVF